MMSSKVASLDWSTDPSFGNFDTFNKNISIFTKKLQLLSSTLEIPPLTNEPNSNPSLFQIDWQRKNPYKIFGLLCEFNDLTNDINSLKNCFENLHECLIKPPIKSKLHDSSLNSDQKIVPDESESTKSSLENYKRKFDYVIGIPNLGNTCFMNSILQCLSSLSLFTRNIQNMDPANRFERCLQSMMKILTGQKRSSVDSAMKQFKAAIENIYPTYCGRQMHDQKQFLSDLLELLRKNHNEISRQFLTIAKLRYNCRNCENFSEFENELLWVGCNRSVKQKEEEICKSIKTLLTDCGPLDCNSCNSQDSMYFTKNGKNLSLAKILVVNLGEHKKNNSYEKIKYPSEIILYDYKYELKAVCAGNSNHGIAIKKPVDCSGNRWFLVNDQQIWSDYNQISDKAILLFYEIHN